MSRVNLPDWLRRLLIRASRGVVLTRRLPPDLGAARLRVSPEASLTYWRGLRPRSFCDLFDFARTYVQPGDHVWDVGVNMGVLTFAAAHRVGDAGRVLGLEPDWYSMQLVQRSKAANPRLARRIEILPLAASDALSLQTLIIPERGRAASHLENAGGAGEEITGGTRARVLVPTVPLDWIATWQPPPDVVKIDVDGEELRVLLGARSILQTRRPRLLVEVYERNADAVGTLLHELGYALYSYDFGERDRQPVSRPTYNTLALPG